MQVFIYCKITTCFGCLSHPSLGVHQTVNAASGTCHITCQSKNLQPAWPCWRKAVALTRDMTCTRSCSYSLMYSWWWVRLTPETCRVILQQINTCILLHLVGSYWYSHDARNHEYKIPVAIVPMFNSRLEHWKTFGPWRGFDSTLLYLVRPINKIVLRVYVVLYQTSQNRLC